MDSCKSHAGHPGSAPTTPAATCTFCSRMARTTSLAVRPRCGDLVRVQPHAHGVVAAAEDLHLAHATDARQPVLDVEHA
jgi:hypothetical protein